MFVHRITLSFSRVANKFVYISLHSGLQSFAKKEFGFSKKSKNGSDSGFGSSTKKCFGLAVRFFMSKKNSEFGLVRFGLEAIVACCGTHHILAIFGLTLLGLVPQKSI